MDFQFYLPENLSFGEDRVETVGVEAAKYGKRALLVTGKTVPETVQRILQKILFAKIF